MEKNWLIRTSQKQILGPISKERVIELIKKGNLTDDDEICSGNGYWFHIKEKNLVEKYIYGNHLQTFNIITEAKSIFTEEDMEEKLNEGLENVSVSRGKETPYPEEGDLEFPDVENSNNIEYSKVENLPHEEDLDYPEIIDKKSSGHNPTSMKEKPTKIKKKKLKRKKIKRDFEESEEPKRNDKYLFYIFLFLLVGLLCIFVFYKNTLNNLFPKVSLSSLFIPDAEAQIVDKKKRNLLPISFKHGELVPILTLGGIFFNETRPVLIENCSVLNDFSFQLFYLLSWKKDEKTRKKVEECLQNNDLKENKIFFQARPKNKKILKQLLKSVSFSKIDKRILIERFQREKISQKSGEFIQLIDSFFNLHHKDNKEQILIYERINFLKNKTIFKSDFIRYLMEILVSIEFENEGRVRKNIYKILKIDPQFFIFSPIFLDMNLNDLEKFEKTLFRVLDFISQKIKDEELRKIFLSYFNLFSYRNFKGFNKLKEKYDVKWTLQEIRRIGNKTEFNFNFTFLIFSILNQKKLYSEGIYFLKKNIDENKLINLYSSEFMLFSHFIDHNIIKSKIFKKRIGEILKEKKPYKEFLMLELMKNRHLKKMISVLDPYYKKANFQLEHGFFSKNLKNDHFKNFCLYKLAKMGHKKSSLLWWLIL